MNLLSVAEAQARLLALAAPLPIEWTSLIEAAGRPAAADVLARRTQPAADISAMDGYAVRFGECPGPWLVVGESAAGRPYGRALAPGEAVRIFTGAAMPKGADTILVQEEAAIDGITVIQDGEGPGRPARNVRPRGADFRDGDRLIATGQRITPATIGLAAVGGHARLPVRRRPRLALISTGDELVPPGAATAPDRLPSSNAPMLAALCRDHAEVIDHGIVGDDLATLVDAFRAAAFDADVLVTTGGVSVGDHDLVRPALQQAGATLDFWRVAMRPGKPLMAGRIGETIVLGLPGNPVSAFVTATLFLRPLLARFAGDSAPLPALHPARLAGPLPAVGRRTDFLRGVTTANGVVSLLRQDSGDLATLARADCLIVRPAGSTEASAGDPVEIVKLG